MATQGSSPVDTADVSMPAADDPHQSDAMATLNTREYLTFMIGGEEFGVDILAVQEIRAWEAVTAIPNAPDQVCGVMNLRGTIVPVVDLRACFGQQEGQFGAQTVVIVLKVAAFSGGEKTVGVVADAVAEVERFDEQAIQSPPELGERVHQRYVKGLGRTEKKMVVLLDLNEHLLHAQNLTARAQGATERGKGANGNAVN